MFLNLGNHNDLIEFQQGILFLLQKYITSYNTENGKSFPLNTLGDATSLSVVSFLSRTGGSLGHLHQILNTMCIKATDYSGFGRLFDKSIFCCFLTY